MIASRLGYFGPWIGRTGSTVVVFSSRKERERLCSALNWPRLADIYRKETDLCSMNYLSMCIPMVIAVSEHNSISSLYLCQRGTGGQKRNIYVFYAQNNCYLPWN